MFTVDHPRKTAREAIRQSVPSHLWEKNERFSELLLKTVHEHRIASHPIIAQLEGGRHDVAAQQLFHLEFGHAFAQIFTDALIQAMFTATQLEPRLGALGKVAARFLLQLNVLDELGFQPNAKTGSDYAGNPHLSHYLQFDATLRQLGISAEEQSNFKPSTVAVACRRTFEDTYGDHVSLTCLLAISETVFTKFCGPWAKSVGTRTSIDVTEGYHSIHVEHDGKFIDDDHSEDAWYVFRQAMIPERYEEILIRAQTSLDVWAAFLDQLAMAAAAKSTPLSSSPAKREAVAP
jgi:hypothetical protein